MKSETVSQTSLGMKFKAMREERRLSMRELASVSGVSASLISKIEAGKVSPTVMSLKKLLDAFSVDLYEFFLDKPGINPAEQIVYKKCEMPVAENDEHRWFYAFPRHPDIKAELIYKEYEPHTQLSEKENCNGDLFGYVISGELTLDVDGKGVYKVKCGDAFYLKARQAHIARNDGDKSLKLVATVLLD